MIAQLMQCKREDEVKHHLSPLLEKLRTRLSCQVFLEEDFLKRGSVTVLANLSVQMEYEALRDTFKTVFERPSSTISRYAQAALSDLVLTVMANFTSIFKSEYERELLLPADPKAVYKDFLGKLSRFCSAAQFEPLEDKFDDWKMGLMHYLVDMKNTRILCLTASNDRVSC